MKKPYIDTFPILTTRVDSELYIYCSGYRDTLAKWVIKIPSELCESNEINLTLTIDSGLMDESLRIAR